MSTTKIMYRMAVLGVLSVLVGVGTAGCQNTAEGLREDTSHDAAAVKAAADTADIKGASHRLVSATDKAAKNLGDNLDARPRIKAAIVRDGELNNTANEVHVNVSGGIVVLSGHVLKSEMKHRAGTIAVNTLARIKSPDKVENKLTVGTGE